jgi:hypothetical protein
MAVQIEDDAIPCEPYDLAGRFQIELDARIDLAAVFDERERSLCLARDRPFPYVLLRAGRGM